MLQIISNSNETSTGPELVQNGDFSQLGADLVENGLFDELGTDVITNGGITGELVTNGNFATDLSSWTSSTYQWLSFNEVNRSSVGTGDKFSQHIATEIGEQYDVSVFVNSYDLAPSLQTDVSYKTINSTGLITQRITAVSTSTEVWIWAVNAQINFSSFSVVKVGESPSDDWTAGTSWVFGKDKAISTQALGSEEVTNGDFSQVGSDLVTNGDFSAAGINLVDNPNFTDGTEEVTYPNFTNSDISQWVMNSGRAAKTWDAAEFMRLTFLIANGQAMYAVFGNTLNVSYKVTMRVRGTKSDGTTAQGSSFFRIGDNATIPATSIVSNPTLTSEWQDYEFYIVPTTTTFRFYLASADIGDLVDFDSISVKELGADWTSLNPTNTFGEHGLTMTSTLAADVKIRSAGAIVANSTSYKVTYTIHDVDLTGTNAIEYYTGSALNGYDDLPEQGIGTHTFYYTTPSTIASTSWFFRLDLRGSSTSTTDFVTISSISVQELGQDWTVGTGWSIGEDKAICDGSTNNSIRQSLSLPVGNIKVTFTIEDFVSGDLNLWLNLPAFTNPLLVDENGDYEVYVTTTSGANNIYFYSVAFIGSVTNVSIKEVGQDWTLTSGASITALGAKITHTPTAGVISQSPSLVIGKSYKFTYEITEKVSGGLKINSAVVTTMVTSVGTHTRYFEADYESLQIARTNPSNNDVTISNISVKEIATSYLTQAVSLSAKTWKIIYSVSDYIAGSVSATDYGAVTTANAVGITEYVQIGVASDFRMVNIDGYFEGAVTDISAQLVDPNGYWSMGAGWTLGSGGASHTGSAGTLQQLLILESGKSYKVLCSANSVTGTLAFVGFSNSLTERTIPNGDTTFYLTANSTTLGIYSDDIATITNISVEQTDPNNYWTLGTGWSIGTDKAISTVTGSNSDITQSILTAGKTYRTDFKIVDRAAGTAQVVVTGSEGKNRSAIETYTEDLTTTGTDFSIRSKLGTFDGAVSSVSAKLLGSYEDQSIYVTAADVQTLPQASVYYLVELTSMASKNSIYFIPSSVVPNNGRYTKLNFTVVSKDALTQPTVGIISFYDSVGGFDTYPMGFYEFKIYEQRSSTNLDPLLATGLLEKGFAFVRDFSGNMQELTDGFKEYNPTLTQYVYSK